MTDCISAHGKQLTVMQVEGLYKLYEPHSGSVDPAFYRGLVNGMGLALLLWAMIGIALARL